MFRTCACTRLLSVGWLSASDFIPIGAARCSTRRTSMVHSFYTTFAQQSSSVSFCRLYAKVEKHGSNFVTAEPERRGHAFGDRQGPRRVVANGGTISIRAKTPIGKGNKCHATWRTYRPMTFRWAMFIGGGHRNRCGDSTSLRSPAGVSPTVHFRICTTRASHYDPFWWG